MLTEGWNYTEENPYGECTYDDKVAPVDVKKFTQYCVTFIDSLEIDHD